TFILFIVLSFLLWFSIQFSREYEDTIKYQLYFTDLPEDALLLNKLPNNIEFKVRTTGLNLFNNRIKTRSIKISYKKINNDYLDVNNSIYLFKNAIGDGIDILGSSINIIKFEFEKKIYKTVPVVAKYDIKYKKGYNLVGKPLVIPDSVVISGAERSIINIFEINTELITLVNVFESEKHQLKLSKIEGVTNSETQVYLELNAEKYTEGSFKLSFDILNRPKGGSLITFPNKVELIFQTNISNYNKVSVEEFEIICDYEYSIKNNLNYLLPIIVKKPDNISFAKIVPERIEYLIQK
ncbi:MAG: hypothetical protein HRT66_01980, partial [Flavobacteriaceae bacterium]|nr:hypothetical protein [Flavobacteriaceae bacterium]